MGTNTGCAFVLTKEAPAWKDDLRMLEHDCRSPVKPPLRFTPQELTDAQHRLVQIMRTCQFGRIENMPVRGGQPVLEGDVLVVRTLHLGGKGASTGIPGADDFELKQSVRDLIAEIDRLQNGTITRLEFRHGLPVLVETRHIGVALTLVPRS